jgi:hypothetical protein
LIDATNENGVFWISDWSFTYENMNLFTMFRKGLGEKRKLDDASFHFFTKRDYGNLESLMVMAMFFTWDSYLILPKRGLVFSPNDNFLHVSCRMRTDKRKIEKMFKWMKLSDWTKWWKDREK